MFLINNCLGYHTFLLFCINNIEYSFKCLLKVSVEESIVNALLSTDQLFKSNQIFCVVCVFTLLLPQI
jgi:hypothetical protein